MNYTLCGATALLLDVAFQGCDCTSASTPEPSPAPPPIDAGTPDVPPPRPGPCDPSLFAGTRTVGPGATYDYVINRMSVDDSDEPPSARGFHGFDLDARRSPDMPSLQNPTDCNHGDYFSTVDPDQNEGTCVAGIAGGGRACLPGVDNQLANIAVILRQFDTTAPGEEALLNQEFAAGRYAVLLRMANVHGALGPALDDPDATLRVYPVAWPTFERCERVQSPGQTYAIDDRSLRAAGDVDRPVVEIPGCIVRGRFRPREVSATGAATPMVLPLLSDARVPIHDVVLRFDLGVDGASGGNFGGTTLQSEVGAALASAAAFADTRELILALVPGFVDVVAPDGILRPSCELPTSMISVGLGFTALRASIAATTVSGPIAGACGSR